MVGEQTDHTPLLPIDSFISVVLEFEGGANMEVATVENGGMFNMAGNPGSVSTFHHWYRVRSRFKKFIAVCFFHEAQKMTPGMLFFAIFMLQPVSWLKELHV
jgi:hypothetical protein